MGTYEATLVGEAIRENAPDDDVAGAFDAWRRDLEDSDAPGKIQAYRIPIDEHGKASHSSTGQIRLGSWPVDQYDFDSLCQIIMKEYMLPNEKIMAVRLIGTLGGKGGVRFNKIVQLQRPNQLAVAPTEGKGGMADVMRAMNESNERMIRMITEMSAGRGSAATASGTDMERTVAMMAVLMKPMQDMMGPILAAFVGRPVTPAPVGGMKETLETMMLMDRFLGRRGGGGGEGRRSDFAEIATAVSSVAAPLLQLANTNAQANLRQRKRPALTGPTFPPASAPAPVNPPVGATPIVLPMDTPSTVHMPDLKGVDTSQPSNPGNDAMFAEIKKQVDVLVQMAANKSQPEAVADLFYDQSMAPLPDEGYGQLAGFVEDETFLSKIAVFNTQVQTHTQWFQSFRARLIRRILEADESPQ